MQLNKDEVKAATVTNVYHLPVSKIVPLHRHQNQDEIFYCVAGEGFGVLENSEVVLSKGKAFIVPAGEMHALRTGNQELCVCSFLIPVVED